MSFRVLLVTPVYYGIEDEIKKMFEYLGYDVIWFENKTLPLDYHGTNSKFKFLRKIYFFLFSPRIRYIKKQLKLIKGIRFDLIFSINGHIICPYLFKKLKEKNPDLRSVLYLWDSSSMYNWGKEIKLFDKVLTYDPCDSMKFGINYKPNFYIQHYHKIKIEYNFDLFFAGKFNKNRLILVDELLNRAESLNIKLYIKLWVAYKIFPHNKLLYRILKSIKCENNWINEYILNYEASEGLIERDYFLDSFLSYDEVQLRLLSSNVILDLPFHEKSGYTHRVIEALANGKKIITTNRQLLNEKFSNPGQIKVLDNINPKFDWQWILERTTFPVSSYIHELELSTWLKSILNVEIA